MNGRLIRAVLKYRNGVRSKAKVGHKMLTVGRILTINSVLEGELMNRDDLFEGVTERELLTLVEIVDRSRPRR